MGEQSISLGSIAFAGLRGLLAGSAGPWRTELEAFALPRKVVFFFFFFSFNGLALKHLRLEKLWSRILDEVLWQVDVSHRGPGEASEPAIAFHSATAMGDGLAESAREA